MVDKTALSWSSCASTKANNKNEIRKFAPVSGQKNTNIAVYYETAKKALERQSEWILEIATRDSTPIHTDKEQIVA